MPELFQTHEVTNQSPDYVDVDLFGSDRPLAEALASHGLSDTTALSAFGRQWGSAEMFEQARLANECVPRLRTFDAKGDRSDVVEFHPAYHRFMAMSMAAGLHNMTWRGDGQPVPAELARAARYYMVAQVENGHMCPITMTRASVGALSAEPALLGEIMPAIAGREYDPRFIPWRNKSAITLGMGMTEKQGGTDVRANTTRAVAEGEGYRIVGHKWFMSAPMSDAFLVLAQAPSGLTCFLMPRFRPDGSVNALHFQRLKDKVGNRSNASSEVEFANAFAWRVGDEGAGVRTILRMVQMTRVDCVISSAGMMRMALAQAIHHARHRLVFKRHLADQPLMRTVLADIALDVEAATALMVRLCHAIDRSPHDAGEAAYARLVTPAAKYWVCKLAPALVYEAMECLGGNGYVEESGLARLYREAPVNAIWEGSGNVVCLDMLRAAAREPDMARAVIDGLARATAGLPGAPEAVRDITGALEHGEAEARARMAVARLAELAAASALRTYAPAIAELVARTRWSQRRGRLFGDCDILEADAAMLIDRALPG